MAKDSNLRNYLEVHSLSFDQVYPFYSIKNFFKDQWIDFQRLFACEFYYRLFHILMIKNSYQVDRALFDSFEIL